MPVCHFHRRKISRHGKAKGVASWRNGRSYGGTARITGQRQDAHNSIELRIWRMNRPRQPTTSLCSYGCWHCHRSYGCLLCSCCCYAKICSAGEAKPYQASLQATNDPTSSGIDIPLVNREWPVHEVKPYVNNRDKRGVRIRKSGRSVNEQSCIGFATSIVCT